MSKIICIRGGNASGKTWTARRVMGYFKEQYAGELVLPSKLKYQDFGSFVVIGSYARATGGADACTYGDVWPAIEHFANTGRDVLVEGVLVGTCYQPWVDMMARLPGHQHIPLCLSTSWEKVVENLNGRRAKEGKPAMEKLTNIEISFRKNVSSAKKFHADGSNPHWVTAEEAVEIAIRELRQSLP